MASSYFIHSSDAFTVRGHASGAPADGYKHWMFVQNVKMDQWVTQKSLKDRWGAVDVLNSWFDEVTLSRSHLGRSENGWDRPYSPTASEFGSLLWLWKGVGKGASE